MGIVKDSVKDSVKPAAQGTSSRGTKRCSRAGCPRRLPHKSFGEFHNLTKRQADVKEAIRLGLHSVPGFVRLGNEDPRL